ncbi:GNAT family N-acetyltransferase [Neobacillus soli]|uniref:GNAT family N-acetyltransferase n=1 Tax=Neobacillus soli TaxID=220688 RepID=UPI0008271C27|nr:GNAT family N-acetyltransferase [Neobacillus soli]
MDFNKEDNRFYKHDETGKLLAEVIYEPDGEHQVLLTHTFVDSSLRGQGVAEQLVDCVVAEMKAEGKKIVPVCSFAVALFKRKPDKYKNVIAN